MLNGIPQKAGDNKEYRRAFGYRTITFYGTPFQGISPNQLLNFFSFGITPTLSPYNPEHITWTRCLWHPKSLKAIQVMCSV